MAMQNAPVFFRSAVLALVLSLLSSVGYGQQLSNIRGKIMDAAIPFQKLDSLSIAPPLLAVSDSSTGQILDLAFFSLKNNFLRIDTARLKAFAPTCSRLRVTYRVLPFNLGLTVKRLDTLALAQSANGIDNYIGYDYSPYEPTASPWESPGLNTNGAYTRGLSFGNSQNLVFNSNLNLQLDGKLGNDLEIKAAISDNSIPIQPDGTTRQLQEFDKIYIQVKRKNIALTAGDYDLQRPKGYFMQYFKRVQGASVEWNEITDLKLKLKNKATGAGPNSRPSARDTVSLRTAAAVSRGKFARQSLRILEGNQGPYRLQGAEGEVFIIVLAGTEKVYLDGQLLRRGLEDDYVIDYNLGEISFTPRSLMTKDKRVIVEFEYATQTYLRSTMAANAAWSTKKARFYTNFYNEQDSRSSGGAQDLSTEERRSLALVGDELRNAYASGVDTLGESIAFDPTRVQYKMMDTLVCGVRVSVLQYSTNADSAQFLARFSQVPQGQGNYVQIATSANGRVFRWVAPDPTTCQPKGNFEPVVKLVAPELKQLYTAGSEFQPFKNTSIQTEVALSNRDLNRFSPLGNGDNIGLGAQLGFRQRLLASKKDKGWQSQVLGNYEFVSPTFNPLNPYRNAEFSRDWNTEASTEPNNEHLLKSSFQAQKNQLGSFRYEFGSFLKGSQYQGMRNVGQLRVAKKGYELTTEGNLLQSEGLKENSRFFRPKLDFSKTFFKKNKKTDPADSLTLNTGPIAQPFLKLGFYAETEKNQRFSAAADTLNRSSFWYNMGRIYFQTPENQGKFQLGGSILQRNDFHPVGKDFVQNTNAREANANGAWQPTPSKNLTQNLTWNLTTRRLKILRPDLTTEEPQNTYLGRIDHNISIWKNAVSMTTGYELGSGQSPKVEFNYVRVNPGEGNYTWVDRNRDSILQVDEMEIAIFQDQATYLRVAVTTSDFIRTNNVVLNQSLRLDPRVLWNGSKKKWKKTLARFSEQSSLLINRRVLEGAAVSAWNPFELNIADSSLVTVSSSMRNALFFNRANPIWDVSLTQTDNRNRLVLTTGYESRKIAEWTAHGRVNIARKFTAETDYSTGQKLSDAQVFNNRDYAIRIREVSPQLSWLPNRQFRTIVKYHWQNSRNNPENGGENAQQTDWGTEITWNPSTKANATTGFKPSTSMRLKGTYAQVKFDGQANTAVGYAMLEGLQNGQNYLWSISLDRQLSKSMQLNISYEGRKTGENRTVHVGRAQVRAVF